MALELDDAIHELRIELARGKLIAFVGSGVSVQSGLPVWDEFLRLYIEFATQWLTTTSGAASASDWAESAKRELEKNPLVVVEVLSRVLRNNMDLGGTDYADTFSHWMVSLFGQAEPGFLHSLIVQTNYAGIITTNYDLLLERACRSNGLAGMASQSFNGFEAGKVLRALAETRPFIWHIHGTLHGPLGSIVFGHFDYENILRSGQAALRKVLQTIFMTNSILFLGYGASDPHVQHILWDLADSIGSDYLHRSMPRRFIPILRQRWNLVLESHMHNLGIETILFNDFEDYEVLVSSLKNSSERFPT